MAIVYQFPPPGDPYEKEVPLWLSFKAAYYSTFSKRRSLGFIKSNAYVDIRIPYPKAMATENRQNYQAGGSLNIRAIELGGIKGVVESFKQELTAKAELAKSFISGGGVVRFDHLETVLQPGARRTHRFSIDLISKTAAQANMASQIALIFQGNVYPIASTTSILTMQHPPLWSIEALGASTPDYWDGKPLVSVLNSVDINRSPIRNTPYMGPDTNPLGININLSFIELEPAMQTGTGAITNGIFSRSDRNSRQA